MAFIDLGISVWLLLSAFYSSQILCFSCAVSPVFLTVLFLCSLKEVKISIHQHFSVLLCRYICILIKIWRNAWCIYSVQKYNQNLEKREIHGLLICDNNKLIVFFSESLILLVFTVICPLEITETLNGDVSLFSFEPFKFLA